MSRPKTILVDFDGVINSYTSGWTGISDLPDPPVDGAIAWLVRICRDERFKVCIYSSRSKESNGPWAMQNWLILHGLPKNILEEKRLHFPTEKPAAYLTIDDRCFLFKGDFPSADEIDNFKPWWKK